MTSDGQAGNVPPDSTDDVDIDPPGALLAAASAAVPGWLGRAVERAVAGTASSQPVAEAELDRVVGDASGRLLSELGALLATDVDDQRSTPLSICRSVGATVAAELTKLGIPTSLPGSSDVPVAEALGLAPASWADIDPSLHEPGITWGAWKAMTILRRRRDDGLR